MYSIYMQTKKLLYRGAERRKFPRASARVIYAAVKNEQYLGTEVYTKDISIGGICFAAKEFIAKDEIICFDIIFPSGKSFTIEGKVLRVEKINSQWKAKEEYKIGAEFINLTAVVQEYIEEYLAKFILPD
ncbi:MAG: PilZ domain-containing protein [Candidatus Omnitrophota bacterium]